MNSNGDGKHEPDPENAVRLLEIELMRQRMAREQSGTPYRGLRVISLIFAFVVLAGALFAFYYLFVAGGLEEFRARTAQPGPSPSAISSRP
jgi:flagellar basal body-associated protein FliL